MKGLQEDKEMPRMIIDNSPDRTLMFSCGRGGVTACPGCNRFTILEVTLQSTFPGEPLRTSYGRKCLLCGWTSPT